MVRDVDDWMRVTLTEEAAAAAATAAAACGSCGLNWTVVADCCLMPMLPGLATLMPGGRGTNCTGAEVLVTTVPAPAVGDLMSGARIVTGFNGRIVVAPPTEVGEGAWTTVSLAPSGTPCWRTARLTGGLLSGA